MSPRSSPRFASKARFWNTCPTRNPRLCRRCRGWCGSRGADALVRAGPPGPAADLKNNAAVQGDRPALVLALVELFPLFAEHGPAAELDLVAFQSQNFDQNLVAFLKLIADIAYAILGDFADVQQPVGSGENLDERAEIHQPDHRTQVRLPHLGRRGQVRDDLDGLV